MILTLALFLFAAPQQPWIYAPDKNWSKPPEPSCDPPLVLRNVIKHPDGTASWSCVAPKKHKPAESMKQSVKPHPGDPNLAIVTPDPCDGVACTGPVEMIHIPSDATTETDIYPQAAPNIMVTKGQCERGNGKWSSDTKTCYVVDQLGAPGAVLEQAAPMDCSKGGCITVTEPQTSVGPTMKAIILRTPTQIAIKLSDDEYTHLESLRAAVVEEEKRIAVKYGAGLVNPRPCPPDCIRTGNESLWRPDHYEYHGQFLLIDKAK